uniref:Uncharacterized protein n=1 Tax=Gopherus agassizii TaxID=38772 RepID=A0A452GP11_9SAUR
MCPCYKLDVISAQSITIGVIVPSWFSRVILEVLLVHPILLALCWSSKTALDFHFSFFSSPPQTVRVSALDVKTPEELFVENGTEARLPCTFSSREEISSLASISWSFQPEGATTSISVRALCLG